MKKLYATIGKIIFYLFVVAVFAWTASLTLGEMKQILPNDPITPYFALALFDIGAIAWLMAWHGTRPRTHAAQHSGDYVDPGPCGRCIVIRWTLVIRRANDDRCTNVTIFSRDLWRCVCNPGESSRDLCVSHHRSRHNGRHRNGIVD